MNYPIKSGSPYFEMGCQAVMLDRNGILRVGEMYDGNLDNYADEYDFSDIMLAVYALAEAAGQKIPRPPTAILPPVKKPAAKKK